jgi:hypothetical protein
MLGLSATFSMPEAACNLKESHFDSVIYCTTKLLVRARACRQVSKSMAGRTHSVATAWHSAPVTSVLKLCIQVGRLLSTVSPSVTNH